MVQIVNSFDEFQQLIQGDKVVVIDFWATWCGPCRAISPIFERLEGDYPDVTFAKVDVDDQSKISQSVGIRAMPTFMAFKNGEKIRDMVGANPTGLRDLLDYAKSS